MWEDSEDLCLGGDLKKPLIRITQLSWGNIPHSLDYCNSLLSDFSASAHDHPTPASFLILNTAARGIL